LSAQRHFGAFRGGSGDEFSGWLRAILRHTLIDFLRAFRDREKRQVSREKLLDVASRYGAAAGFISAAPSPVHLLIRREQDTTVARCLEELPPAHRVALRLRYQGRHSFREVGDALGISEEAARKLCVRAAAGLGRLLRSRGFGAD